MFGKRTRLLTMLAAALGIPYAWFNENLTASLSKQWNSWKNGAASLVGDKTEPDFRRPWTPTNHSDAPSRLAAHSDTPTDLSTHGLIEVLRFDITSRWVISQWGRVSSVRAEADLEGLRVPLVTGTNLDDVAGSLTYYFDRHHQLRRISLQGQTGDDKQLIEIATKYFGLRQEPSLGAGMFVKRWNALPMNALRISHAPVVRVDTPNAKFIFELELNDVTAGYGLSAEFRHLLGADQQVQRWGA